MGGILSIRDTGTLGEGSKSGSLGDLRKGSEGQGRERVTWGSECYMGMNIMENEKRGGTVQSGGL